jgi:hypothetical protein
VEGRPLAHPGDSLAPDDARALIARAEGFGSGDALARSKRGETG